MYTIFCNNLTAYIRESIKAHVSCTVRHDQLEVHIYATGGIEYHYKRRNISSDILNSVTSQTVAYIIVKQYRKHINELFFK